MVDTGGPTQRFVGALVAIALVLAVSGCTRASPLATSTNGASESIGPSATLETSPSLTPEQTRGAGAMTQARTGHTATLLLDGTVLVAGGQTNVRPLASAEAYDPGTELWSAAADMHRDRVGHTATLLLDGRVLVVAGYCAFDGGTQSSAEIYDPDRGTWTLTEPFPPLGPDGFGACGGHTATLLVDGRVLVAGGWGSFPDSSLASAELWDPRTGAWVVTGSMLDAHHGHTATLLADGRVLVAGGGTPYGPQDSAELYDPRTGTWTATASMHEGHARHTATRLLDGTVLIAGGSGNNLELPPGEPLVWAELYDPISGSWAAARGMIEAHEGHTATLLSDGRVLLMGVSAEMYDPLSGSWTAAGDTIQARSGHAVTLLRDGRALVTGGCCDVMGNPLASVELYD